MRKFVLFLAISVLAGPVMACAILSPFEMSQIPAADLVVVGEVTEYEDLDAIWGAALVTVRIEQALKGRAKGEVTFLWTAGMAQGPHRERASGRVLIGAMAGGRIAVTTRVPDLRPDLPSVVQPYCGEVWMQPATPGVVKAARKALE